MNAPDQHPASYRDPSGFIFQYEGQWYRQVNRCYEPHYRQLMDSGLYAALAGGHLLLPHQEVAQPVSGHGDRLLTLLPEQLPFTSYPVEWCFDQLKDAALLTLRIALAALDKDMVLKDATPLNIQFVNGKPILIDTLSFEKYEPGQPWVAYRQFCECFLYPLLLQHYGKLGIAQVFKAFPEGIPATETATLLPRRSRWRLGTWLHVHLPARYARAKPAANSKAKPFSVTRLRNLLQHLQQVTEKLRMPTTQTNWNDYYSNTILSNQYLLAKEAAVKELTDLANPATLLDAGCNDGWFSTRLATAHRRVVAADFDAACINTLYNTLKKEGIPNVLPLCIDMVNPTPATGFENSERVSFIQRTHYNLVLALALVHHLAISHNLPFDKIAGCFAGMGHALLVEFVPKADEKVQLLLAHRKDIFDHYTQAAFEEAFSRYFSIIATRPVPGSHRILYLMRQL